VGGRMFPKVRVAMSIAILNGACPTQAPGVLQRRHPRLSGMRTHRMGHRRRSEASSSRFRRNLRPLRQSQSMRKLQGPPPAAGVRGQGRRDFSLTHIAPMPIFCASLPIFVLRVMAASMAARPGLASAGRGGVAALAFRVGDQDKVVKVEL
jgi:hypothetical protein